MGFLLAADTSPGENGFRESPKNAKYPQKRLENGAVSVCEAD
jgi:hypothetical protein